MERVEPLLGQPVLVPSLETEFIQLWSWVGHCAEWLLHIIPFKSHNSPDGSAITAAFLAEEETKPHTCLLVTQSRAKFQ